MEVFIYIKTNCTNHMNKHESITKHFKVISSTFYKLDKLFQDFVK